MRIEKKHIIKLLEEIADLLEFKGENSFKVKAYRMGAVAIRRLEEDINEVIKKKSLEKLRE
jgi:DNA polymerase (family X)